MDSDVKRVLWVGNLPEMVTEDLLCELFTQAGPVESVKIVKDRTGGHRGYAFVTFKHEESVPYTIALMEGIRLFGNVLKLQRRSGAENDDNPYLKAIRDYQASRCSANNAENPQKSYKQHTHDYKYNTDRKTYDNYKKTSSRNSGYKNHQAYSYEEKVGKNKDLRQNRSFDSKESNSLSKTNFTNLNFEESSIVNQNMHEKNTHVYEENKSATQLEFRPNVLQEHTKTFFHQGVFQPILVQSLPNLFNIHYHPYRGNS
ncbi:RNA-binding protein 7-like [Centruroides sculpturatus]|uniref:RNA-binding protein 7-like n=1 Tax=Centruroides sculpturatus TaxID=218467 RepID=UPI000C6E6976|nr:RNA-binding protein 7-like [Centruroides sculpturatus]